MESTWAFSSVIRGHHVSKAFWTPTIGEVLNVARESGNLYDSHAIATQKAGVGVVGHVPREYSRAFWNFLEEGDISCRIDGDRKFGRGLEVPCSYIFHGKKKEIKKLKKKLSDKLSTQC